MHYLSRRERKKEKKEMETLVLVIATVQEYPIRDIRNRSKRKSQQRHDTGEKREKKKNIVIPPTPMFPKQEFGHVLLCHGVHRVGATFDFQGHFQFECCSSRAP